MVTTGSIGDLTEQHRLADPTRPDEDQRPRCDAVERCTIDRILRSLQDRITARQHDRRLVEARSVRVGDAISHTRPFLGWLVLVRYSSYSNL